MNLEPARQLLNLYNLMHEKDRRRTMNLFDVHCAPSVL